MKRLIVSERHLQLVQVRLQDQTDRHNELVQARRWLLHPSEKDLRLRGNLFAIENMLDATGRVLVRQAPLPHARQHPVAADLSVRPVSGGFEFSMYAEDGSDASWTVLNYAGGRLGRCRVLQQWQRGLRPSTPGHTCPRFLVNTWGDRSRDSRLNHDFVEAEIHAAARLGADVVQLDDGWQRGVSSNSVLAKTQGGLWQGFWAGDEHFWTVHPERFPEGLGPLVDTARGCGLGFGLWYAPDSADEFANWRRDADAIVAFHDTYGVEHVKIDSVKMFTDRARENLTQLFEALRERTGGRLVVDLDVTAEVRPGYFGACSVGPLFVENRYSDAGNWWPHQTLRNLWQLAHWVDPLRLRMEFLNNTRNADKYGDDVLAPVRYSASALFASVMFSNPLGWFEASNLPQAFVDSARPLIETWKAHREAMFAGTVVPVGGEPNGFNATGFVSVGEGKSYAVVFRQVSDSPTARIDIADLGLPEGDWEVLGGSAALRTSGGALEATIPNELGFVFGWL